MKHTLGGIEEDVDVPEAQVTEELERSTDQTERSAEQTELPPEQTELLPELVAHLQKTAASYARSGPPGSPTRTCSRR